MDIRKKKIQCRSGQTSKQADQGSGEITNPDHDIKTFMVLYSQLDLDSCSSQIFPSTMSISKEDFIFLT